MEEEEIKNILERYKDGKASGAEKALLENWYLTYQEPGDDELDLEARSKDLDVILLNLEKAYRKKSIKLWPGFAAASVILLIALGFYFYRPSAQILNMEESVVNQGIKPGSNKAYLTLSDGRRISLTDASSGEVAKQSGIRITKNAEGQLIYTVIESDVTGAAVYNTFETPKGGKYQVCLPDGTKVWMNAASTLKYPASFATFNQRIVNLDGEAYFEVSKDKAKPFIVITKKQNVKVLGTYFNINAYHDEPDTKTTLLEGSIELNNDTDVKLLKPGEQAETTESRILVSVADTDQALAWKNGDFVFEGASLRTIMRQISRWYDVEVSYEGQIADLKFGGSISRTKNITAVLRVLELTKGVHFKIEGRRILVMP
ncbi:anti-sigma factor [Pedobacter sp. KBW06]|uniref:FecR family protein n=1 Tax=Pedobacter sp. KBW06 TaxID=2153359 RepID=UPI000F595A57|nr:FecR domain-containing protein [Pedobacter sp. KBW06]RQO69836.1 anti-sigma factor [Pedobacter sp. KBW06]